MLYIYFLKPCNSTVKLFQNKRSEDKLYTMCFQSTFLYKELNNCYYMFMYIQYRLENTMSNTIHSIPWPKRP